METSYENNGPISFRNRTGQRSPTDKTVTSRGIEYDPTSKKSIQEFLKNPEIKKEIYRNEATGDLYYLDRENSSFIVIEGGDYNKIHSILVTNLSEDTGGWERVTSEQLQQRARIYMVAKDSIQSGVKDVNKKRKDGDKLTFKSFVIDPKFMHVRGYISPEVTDTTTVKTGTLIDVDKGIWERIDNIVKSKDEKHDRRVDDKKADKMKEEGERNIEEEEEEKPLRSKSSLQMTSWDPKNARSTEAKKKNGYHVAKKLYDEYQELGTDEILNKKNKKHLHDIYTGCSKMYDFKSFVQGVNLSDKKARAKALTQYGAVNTRRMQEIRTAMNAELKTSLPKPESQINEESSKVLQHLNKMLENCKEVDAFVKANKAR